MNGLSPLERVRIESALKRSAIQRQAGLKIGAQLTDIRQNRPQDFEEALQKAKEFAAENFPLEVH